ncbi:MAG: hypothetical protein WB995_17485 [Candidatus Acidiferrales bacterium]
MYWHSVTYKTVIVLVVLFLAIVGGATYLVFPGASGSVLGKIADSLTKPSATTTSPTAKQARFVNLDGKVQVKKVNSVQWANADYQLTLDKGDLIQTGSEGVARLQFADGTTYTVKGDTLVTVEENLIEQDKATRVGVHIQAGQVDLATPTWNVPGSKADISFENAVASLRENSRAEVRSDPKTQQQQMTVNEGSADMKRGGEHVEVAQWERVTFPTNGAITKEQVLAPPALISPLNLSPIIVADPKKDPVHFEWKPVATAKAYLLQISKSTLFNKVLFEKRTADTSLDITGLEPGDYFWKVRAVDNKDATSDLSDPYKFTLVAQGKEQDMLLEVDNTELHGSLVEVSGRTEPGATLIINGEKVADVRADGTFHYFTPPMSKGSQTIVITGQNRRGGTAIKRVSIVIP